MRTVFDLFEHSEKKVESKFVAGKQDVLFILEVVIKVSLCHVEGAGNFIDTRSVVTSAAKRGCGTL
jgi:hypothetical protein